ERIAVSEVLGCGNRLFQQAGLRIAIPQSGRADARWKDRMLDFPWPNSSVPGPIQARYLSARRHENVSQPRSIPGGQRDGDHSAAGRFLYCLQPLQYEARAE